MSQPADALMVQFLSWVAEARPSDAAVLEAWQSSCPRLSIWEDALIEGRVAFDGSRARRVVLTAAGRARLAGNASSLFAGAGEPHDAPGWATPHPGPPPQGERLSRTAN